MDIINVAILDDSEVINVTISEGASQADLNALTTRVEDLEAVDIQALLLPLSTSIATSGTLTLAFDRASGRDYNLTGANAPTGNITFTESGSTNCAIAVLIDKNSSYTVSFPSTWEQIGSGSLTDSQRNLVSIFKAFGKTYYQILDAYDAIAPTFTALTVSGETDSGATINATLNEASTVYWGVYSSASSPSKSDILAGTGATDFGSFAATANTSSTGTIDSLTSNTTYYLYVFAEDSTGNETDIQAAVSFTTTVAYTAFNDTTTHIKFGDIMDSLLAATDTRFAFEISVKDFALTEVERLFTKFDGTANRAFSSYINNGKISFVWYADGTQNTVRHVEISSALTVTTEQTIRIEYNGAIDTNDGLDRVTIKVNDVVQSTALNGTTGTLGDIFNSTAQLAFGEVVAPDGTPLGTGLFGGVAKGFKLQSWDSVNSVWVDEIHVPVISDGTDTSGNLRHGTFVA